MKMTLAIPFMNQLNDTKGIIGLLRHVTSDDVEWLIVDNGSTEPIEEYFRRYIKPKRLNYIRNQENVGLVKTYQQIYKACETELLAYVHNDVFIYEFNWDKKVIHFFETVKGLGMVGLFGAQGCGSRGERIQDVPSSNINAGKSNMLEAEIHGMRMNEMYSPAAIFDGFAMIIRKEVLDKSGGIDQNYNYHHIYDREMSLISLASGYKNIILDIPCHHISGMTANRPEYQKWIDSKVHTTNFVGDKTTHDGNSDYFEQKWKDYLPVYINDDFSFRGGRQGIWDFKGDKILNFNF